MTNDTKHQTTFSSIITLLLRQHRMERGLTKSKFSELLGLSPSAWGKIENGETQLSINILQRFKVASPFTAWGVIATGEYYENLLEQHNWEVVNVLEGSDNLLSKANEYYLTESKDDYPQILFTGILNDMIAPVFKTILENKTPEQSDSAP